jgi:hypothetical protein
MTRRATLLGLSLAASLALAACGGGATAAPATGDPGGAPAATAPAAPSSAGAQVPAEGTAPAARPVAAGLIDACALLTVEEVAALVPEPTPTPDASEDGPIPTYSCEWSAANPDTMIPVSVAVSVQPGFVSGSGASPDFVKAMIEAEGGDPENQGRVVDGLGDAASVTSVVAFDATVQFLQDDTLVQVVYTGENGASKQDAVVELARAVAGRLP